MSFKERAADELKAVILTTAYFAICFGVLVAIKRLILADYNIAFRGLSLALLGALVAAKVVLVMQHVSLGQWIHRHPAIVDVLLRTILYAAGVFAALVLEKAFEARHEYGGFGNALSNILEHRDMPHVWVNTICVGIALLLFNIFTVLRRGVGTARLVQLYFVRPQAPAAAVPEQ